MRCSDWNSDVCSSDRGLAGKAPGDAPHLILFPERAYDEADFLARVREVVAKVGYCVVVASEGIRTADGRFVADAGGGKDSFRHTQLGGVASYLAGRVQSESSEERRVGKDGGSTCSYRWGRSS